ncbi:MAG: universal stress protein [Pseudanabaenaceae cyanobacterium]|jgi:nucleotide-binding universal stress UspA family protein
MFKRILFPVNNSREARQATDAAVSLAKTFSAQVWILSVVADEAAVTASETERLLAEVAQEFKAADIPTTERIVVGKPAFTICDTADELSIDLIIMGSQGMVVAHDHPDGSVSQTVVNLSPCAVLVVP